MSNKKPAGVYLHTNATNDEVFFISVVNDVKSRPYHKSKETRNKIWWTYFQESCYGKRDNVIVKVIKTKNFEEAKKLGSELIAKHQPTLNDGIQEYNAMLREVIAHFERGIVLIKKVEKALSNKHNTNIPAEDLEYVMRKMIACNDQAAKEARQVQANLKQNGDL